MKYSYFMTYRLLTEFLQVRGAGLKILIRSDCEIKSYLQEVDEVAQHQPAELRQQLDHGDGGHGVVAVIDTLLVEVHGDERFLQFPIPQLHQGG